MKESFSFGRILGISLLVFVVLILICTAFGSFYTIDQGERGIKLRYGAVVSVSEPGFHFKWPFIDDVKLISVRTETMHYQNMSAYSRDQQPAKIIASVTYRVPDSEVGTLYNQYQTVDAFVNRVINRQVPTQIENVFGQFNAITAVQDRARLIKELTDSVKASMKNDPIIIDSVQVENIIFSEAYEKSVESRMPSSA